MSDVLLSKNRILLLMAVMAVFVLAAVACGSDGGGTAASAANNAEEQSSDLPVVQESTGDAQDTTTTSGAGGIDPECVELVVGRSVTGFADITDAERERIFAQCSPGGPGAQGAGSAVGFRGAGFDEECVVETLGEAVEDSRDLTADQRVALFEACGGEFAGGAPPEGFEPGQFGGGLAGNFAEIFDPVCVQETIGRTVEDVSELTQEERQTLFTECGPELPDGTNFTPGQFGGRGGGGFGGQFGQNGQVIPAATPATE